MNVSVILMRRAHLFSQAAVACARARSLYAEVQIQRNVLQAQRQYARRLARLARGERDDPQVPKAADGIIRVVERRVCPRCGKGAIKPDGCVTTANGLIKTTYRCDACGQSFVSVRQTLD